MKMVQRAVAQLVISALGLSFAVMVPRLFAAQPPGASPLRVVSAQRTEELQGWGSSPIRSSDAEIVLLLTIDGAINSEEWNNARGETFYLTNGKDKYPVLATRIASSSTGADMKTTTTFPRIALFRTPRQQMEFQLHFGSRPVLKFSAERAIRQII